MNVLVSVIVPVYNVEPYLIRCVKSIVNQTYKDIEILLIDDGSTDNSGLICDNLSEKDKRITVIHKKNGGLSSARNVGIKNSHGSFLMFVDSDDWIANDYIEYALTLIVKNGADLADVNIVQVRNENDITEDKKENICIYSNQDILVHYLYRGLNEKHGAPFSACRKLYNRNLFTGDTECFDEGTINEDICYNFLILRKCNRVVVSNLCKYYYFQGEQSSITSGKLKKRDLDLLNVCDELVELAEATKNPRIIELAKMKRARSDYSLLAKAALNGIDGVDSNTLKAMQKNLRNNLMLIMKSPMPFFRKIVSLMIAINYPGVSFIARLVKGNKA